MKCEWCRNDVEQPCNESQISRCTQFRETRPAPHPLLDNIKIRPLENGYTVKYHVTVAANMAGAGPSGFVKETYVSDKENLRALLNMLIDKYVPENLQSIANP